MNLDVELKKLTIINRMCENWLRLHPHAYMDYGRPGAIYDAYHNKRAELMQRVEDYDNYKWIVEFDPDTQEAVLLDRQWYLANWDEIYPLYHR